MLSWKCLSSNNNRYEIGGFVDALGSVHPILVSMVCPKETVLEVGCSSGYISERLKLEKQCTVVGIEVDKKAAEVARNRVGIPVFVSTRELPELPAEYGGHFDVILCADVVEHTCNPLEFIEHLKAYASPRGRFIFSIPNIAHWTARLNLLRGEWEYKPLGLLDYTHLRFFTLDSVLRLIHEAGLRVRSVSFSCGPIDMFLSTKNHRYWRSVVFRMFQYLSKRFPRLFAFQFIIEADLC